jgi:hypothetical protein
MPRRGTKPDATAFEAGRKKDYLNSRGGCMGWWGFAAAAGLSAVLATSAMAAETYSYSIRHPTLGEIGTYTDRVERRDGQWQVDTTVRIAARVLGIVMHREEAQRRQIWRDGRLVFFHGITTTNGVPIEVRGEAEGDAFRVATPAGTEVAPANVVLSDPWQASRSGGRLSTGTMLSTKTGRIGPVEATGGESERLSVDGVALAVKHYAFASDKRQDVWLDSRGIPVMFRTIENGTPIDFVLSHEALSSLAALSR